MLYRKNLFQWEQALRVVSGLAVMALPFAFEMGSVWPWLGGGAFFALTGVFGFCPACYLMGRKTPSFGRPQHE